MSAAEFWSGLSLRARDEEAVIAIRDAFFALVDGGAYTKEDEPHVTLTPRFRLPESTDRARLFNEVSEAAGSRLRITGLSAWPGLEDPRVVMLDVEETDRIAAARNRTKARAEAFGGKVKTEPVPPHITLFSVDDPQNKRAPDDIGVGRVIHETSFGGWTTEFGGAFVRRKG